MEYFEVLDIPSAKERFLGNEQLYKKFLYKYPDNTLMQELEQQLEEQNIEEAFKVAHSMKGATGNLSMIKLMDASSVVTEKLRAGHMPEEAELEALREAHRVTVEAVKAVMEDNTTLF